jgi:hypothetical protein
MCAQAQQLSYSSQGLQPADIIHAMCAVLYLLQMPHWHCFTVQGC